MSELHGLLLADKPSDMTSHDVVARVRKALRQKSVGHTGTLDPLATGLLILVLGDATKLSDYLMAENKTYEVRVQLGLTTDTLDCTGQVLTQRPCELDCARIEQAALAIQGEFEWPVPLFSAAKIDGKKLYEHGRAGESVELPTKQMSFYDLQVLSVATDWIRVRLSCSKGSFIRTWASELGQSLGVGGCVAELRRTHVGSMAVTQAVSLGQLEKGELGEAFVAMGQALPGLRSIMANAKEGRLVGNGQIPRDMENRLIVEQKQAYADNKAVFVKVISHSGDLLAIVAAEPGRGLKIKRVFRSLA